MSDLSGRTTVVVGASRGLGRGIAHAFAEAGAPVVAVARTAPALAELAATAGNIRTEIADAADATVAWRLLDQYEPEVLILVAGANPVMRPLQHQTWETFSVNWNTDVKIAFTWLREALLKPLPPASRVVVVSSGAAINGSPASGGYARGQGHPAVHRGVRAGGVAPCRTGHHGHDGDAQDEPVRRRGQAGDSGLRGPRRPDRGGVPEAAGRIVDPRDGRVRPGGAGTSRRRDRRPGVPAHRRGTAEAAMKHRRGNGCPSVCCGGHGSGRRVTKSTRLQAISRSRQWT